MIHQIPAHAAFRAGTVDREIWHGTIELNQYRMPHVFGPDEWVMDVGAHTGSFAWRAANTGAQVIAVEASRANYPLLIHNLIPVWDHVLCLHAAVWRSDEPLGVLSLEPGRYPANTGGGTVMGDTRTHGHDVLSLPLDDLLRRRPAWRMLKIDCEGAEFAILGTSRELRRVHEIVGEYHHRENVLPFADVGMPCKIDALKAHLVAQGFAVEVEEKGEGMGLFWARKRKGK